VERPVHEHEDPRDDVGDEILQREPEREAGQPQAGHERGYVDPHGAQRRDQPERNGAELQRLARERDHRRVEMRDQEPRHRDAEDPAGQPEAEHHEHGGDQPRKEHRDRHRHLVGDALHGASRRDARSR